MLPSTSKSSSGKARDCHEKQNVIFCEEIGDFFIESRKCQTVYANFEGYHERVVKYNDLRRLLDLVFLTLSDGKDRASLTPDEFAETEKLTKLIAKKIYVSRMKFKCNDIRFQVIWIYYYSEKEMKAMPVFKVYKRSWGPEALYIDITGVEYDSWDHFRNTMHSQLPASVICFPRGGEYTFEVINDRDMLVWENICKNSQLLNKSYRNIRPFSQTLIQQTLHNAMPFVKTVTPFLTVAIEIAETYGLRTHPVMGPIMECIRMMVIFLRILEIKWERKVSENALQSIAADYTIMLLNDKGQIPSHWINSFILLYDMVENFSDIMNCLKNPWENWREILKFVPMLTEICKPFISEVSGVEGAVLSVLLEFITTLLSQTTEKEEIKEKGSEESDNWLYNLERYSSANVFSELKASSRLSPGKEILRPSLGIEDLQESGFDLFGFRVYLLLKHTEPDCKRFLQRLLKSNDTLQEGICFQNVIHDGSLIGVVIPFSFQSQNHAIVVLDLDNLSYVRNRKRYF